MRVARSQLITIFIILSGGHLISFAQLNAPEMKILTESADIIIIGKVTEQTSSWNENKSRIYTSATIQAEEFLKGNNNGNSVSVKYPGGEVDDIGEVYSHMPRFENNEDVLLFLKRDEKSTEYKVLNGEDGKISIASDPNTGERILASNVKVSTLRAQIKSYLNN